MVLALFACLCVQWEAAHSDCPQQHFDFKINYPGKDSASCFITPLRSHSMWQQQLCPELGFRQQPPPPVSQHRGTVGITSKPKLWLTSTRSTCLLMTPTTCSCKLIICGRSGVQPLGLVGGDFPPGWVATDLMSVVHTLLFSRTRTRAGTGTVHHIPLGTLPCPERKRLLSL